MRVMEQVLEAHVVAATGWQWCPTCALPFASLVTRVHVDPVSLAIVAREQSLICDQCGTDQPC